MLSDFLNTVTPDGILFISPEGVRCTQGMLLSFCCGQSDLLHQAAGKNVAILIDDDFSLALYLVLLDGNCNRLTLLPPEETRKQLTEFLVKSESDLLITHLTDTEFQIETIIAKRSFESDCNHKISPVFAENHCDTEWILTTSGTTGSPKLVRHSLASLTRTTKARTATSNRFKWGLLYNLQRFAGLQVFFQSVISGACLIFSDDTKDLKSRISHMVRYGSNALSATPTMWRKILMQPNADQLEFMQITLGGEIADQQILTALCAEYPNAKVRHIYASTEAGVGFSVNDGLAGFPEDFLDHPPVGIELDIVNNILFLRSDSNSVGYLGSGQVVKEDSGFVNTGDRVRLEGCRYFFLGRDNGAINVGGNKVQPEEIEQVINAYEGVLLSLVKARSSHIVGSLIEANIVVHSSVQDHKTFVKALRRYCREVLQDYKVPAFINVVDELEVNSMGKIGRS